jgi:hypothetical protein
MWVRKTDTPAEAADKKNVLTAIVGRYKKKSFGSDYVN